MWTNCEFLAHGRRTAGLDRRSGWDDILNGRYLSGTATLVRGAPGTGKSIFSLHFLAAGLEAGDTGLYINRGEPEDYVRDTASHFGFDIDALRFLNLSASGDEFQSEETYTLFESGAVETPSLVDTIRTEIREIDPDRVVVDPVTEFRYLAPDDHQFRSQILSLVNFLKTEGATVFLTSQTADSMPDDDLQFLVDAVINLETGRDRRTIHVSRFRGSSRLRRPGVRGGLVGGVGPADGVVHHTPDDGNQKAERGPGGRGVAPPPGRVEVDPPREHDVGRQEVDREPQKVRERPDIGDHKPHYEQREERDSDQPAQHGDRGARR